jgi:pyridinium-3,5-bisthiocarboxylic acid mononucleotide nickel chelatase
LREIREVVEQSSVSPSVKERALRVFTRICTAEAAIHGMSVEDVHLHEVGGVDAIVDVVGVLAGFEMLGIGHVVVSPLPMGRGFIRGAHGMIPLPAPATVSLLQGVPVCGSPVDAELVTPTGAALLVELADAWGSLPSMTLETVGYGAGTRDLPIPNILRLMIGETASNAVWNTETIVMLETNLDNDRGETIGHAARRLLTEGALDVTTIPVHMKKDRPASLVQVMSRPADADRLEKILFEETSTLGIRRTETRRDALPRGMDSVTTRYGEISVKLARLPDGNLRATPEYEDCRKAAEAASVPLLQVQHEAEHAAAHKFGLAHGHGLHP